MKQIILALMLAVAGIGAAVAANPIREGNMISGHVRVSGFPRLASFLLSV